MTLKTVILIVLCIPIFSDFDKVASAAEACPSSAILAEVNTTYTFVSSASQPCTFSYGFNFSLLTEQEILDTRLDIQVDVDDGRAESEDSPLMVAVRQQHTSTLIKLPYSFQDQNGNQTKWYYSSRRTLCLTTHHGILNREEPSVMVYVETYNLSGIKFSICVSRLRGLLMHIGDSRRFDVSPMAPTFFRFEFDNNPEVHAVEFLTKSNGVGANICTIVAIDDSSCPVYDLEENVARTVEWKHMTRVAVTRLFRKDFPNGLKVLLIPRSSDENCAWVSSDIDAFNANRNKTLTLEVMALADSDPIRMVAIQITLVFLPVFVIAMLIFCCCEMKLRKSLLKIPIPAEAAPVVPDDVEAEQRNADIQLQPVEGEGQVRNGVLQDAEGGHHLGKDEMIPEEIGHQAGNEEMDPPERPHSGGNGEIKLEEDIHLIKTEKREGGPDLKAQRPNFLNYHDVVLKAGFATYNRFCLNTLYTSVFYIIPAFQFLLYHQKSMIGSGDFDHCYFNELCRVRIPDWSDFNHFISNILYIFFGLSFAGIVCYRSYTLKKHKDRIGAREMEKRGLRIPYGAYYAMGMSLIAEGLLSSAYHFCPSGSTFQFDVAFMYVICVIILSCMYQVRHNGNPTGTNAFVLLVILTCVSGIFSFFESRNTYAIVILRWLFVILHALGTLAFCIGLFCFGTIKESENGAWVLEFYNGPKALARQFLRCAGPPAVFVRPSNLILGTKILQFVVTFFANLLSSLVFAIAHKDDFAHFLLDLLILNIALVLVFYVIWRVVFHYINSRRRSELPTNEDSTCRFVCQSLIYFGAGIVLFAFALHKFNINLTDWQATPAQSRAFNRECSQFWQDYDEHDVWHFLSAAALFCFFLGLLTIDDALILEERTKIPVF